MYKTNTDCNWNVLDYSHRILLALCLIIFGTISFILNLWLLLSFLRNPKIGCRSYLFVLIHCITYLAKTILVGFPVEAASATAGMWLFDNHFCNLFAFLRLNLNIFQITYMTAMMIERYLLSNVSIKVELSFYFYMTSLLSCSIFSLLLSIPPLIGIGKFTCDPTSTICHLEWRFIEWKQSIYNILIFLFAGVLPINICCWSLWKIITRPKNNCCLHLNNRLHTNKAFTLVVILTLLFKTPEAFAIFWQMFLNGLFQFPKSIAIMAPICSEAAAAFSVLIYLVFEPTLSTALISLLKTIGASRKHP